MLSLEQVVEQSDILTIHLPKNKETNGILNAAMLARAKPSLRIVNVARGGIANETDLAEALRNGTIAGAAIDVFVKEPTTESPLFLLDNLFEAEHVNSEFARTIGRNKWVECDEAHVECSGALGNEGADATETQDAKRLARKFDAFPLCALPSACNKRAMRLRHIASNGKNECHGVFGCRKHI